MKGMFDTFTSSGEAQKAEFAIKRNGFTRDQFERLVAGDFLGLVRELVDLPLEFMRWLVANLSLLRQVYDGNAEIVRIERLTSSAATSKTFPIWKTLSIGGVSKKELQKRLVAGGYSVSDWAKDIMGKPAFITSAEAHEVSFVRVKVGDLGFTKSPTTTELFDPDRLAGFGLNLCEPEDGPFLRLAVSDEPRGDWFWVAMQPITDSGGGPLVFYVERDDDGKQWLNASYARPSYRWRLSSGIVFRLRK